MELSPFDLYLIFQADALRGALAGTLVTAGLSGAAWLVGGGIGVLEEDISPGLFKKIMFALAGLFMFSGLALALVPSTKTLVAIYGIPAAIEGVQQVEGVGELPDNLVGALNHLLKSYQGEEGE